MKHMVLITTYRHASLDVTLYKHTYVAYMNLKEQDVTNTPLNLILSPTLTPP